MHRDSGVPPRHVSPGRTTLERLGPLEWRVLQALWERSGRASVRDLTGSFSDIAYTTIMTTLDRLHRKKLLERTKSGRAFVYWPRLSRAEFHSAEAVRAVRTALEGRAEPELLLSHLVDAVTERDIALLDELEALVRARRGDADEGLP